MKCLIAKKHKNMFTFAGDRSIKGLVGRIGRSSVDGGKEMKNLAIRAETHAALKEYCMKNGLKMHYAADKAIMELLRKEEKRCQEQR